MSGLQIIPLAVKASFTGNVNTTHVITEECEALSITNRGAAQVTFTVNSISITVGVSETFTGYFRDFTTVDILATDNYALVVYGR